MKVKFLIAFISLVSAFAFFHPEKQPLPNFRKGVWVIQYNAEFNKNNEYNWLNVGGINYHLFDLDQNIELKSKMKIHSVPTIVVYKNGREVKRWEAGMQFKITIPQREIINHAKK